MKPLFSTLEHLEDRQRQYDNLKAEVSRLRRELQRGNTSLLPELLKAKEQLQQAAWLEDWIFKYRRACNLMIRRLDSVLDGGKPHTSETLRSFVRDILPGFSGPTRA